MRNSKAYAGFKVFNGIVFIALGAAIVVQMLRLVGPRFEALSGVALGAALIALGLYRTIGFVRMRR